MTPEFVTVLVAIIGMIVAFLGGYMWGWDDCMRRNESIEQSKLDSGRDNLL